MCALIGAIVVARQYEIFITTNINYVFFVKYKEKECDLLIERIIIIFIHMHMFITC